MKFDAIVIQYTSPDQWPVTHCNREEKAAYACYLLDFLSFSWLMAALYSLLVYYTDPQILIPFRCVIVL